ncbi:MAG: hypothetical protein G01um101431_67 [Parcubacteria group bacterium Gr01-1014_31]|nr:MAG: hypothetical protein G01um101431_67 [Parcubacteria group bacterium Gr01-1014_31]
MKKRTPRRHQLCQVALKCFITDPRGRLLVIRGKGKNGWDLPGGRVEHREFPRPLTTALRRELHEEIGSRAKVSIRQPFVVYKHRAPGKAGVLLVGYHCDLRQGSVRLGKHQESYAWLNRRNYRRFRFLPWHRPAVDTFFKEK